MEVTRAELMKFYKEISERYFKKYVGEGSIEFNLVNYMSMNVYYTTVASIFVDGEKVLSIFMFSKSSYTADNLFDWRIEDVENNENIQFSHFNFIKYKNKKLYSFINNFYGEVI